MGDTEVRTFTQDEVNALVGDARVKAREKAQGDAATQATKDKDTADQATMLAKQEWQKLAELSQARVQVLEPLEKRIEGYEELVKGLLKESLETLGDAAKTAVTGLPKSMTAIEKLTWVKKNSGLFQAPGDGVGTPQRPAHLSPTKNEEPRRVNSL